MNHQARHPAEEEAEEGVGAEAEVLVKVRRIREILTLHLGQVMGRKIDTIEGTLKRLQWGYRPMSGAKGMMIIFYNS